MAKRDGAGSGPPRALLYTKSHLLWNPGDLRTGEFAWSTAPNRRPTPLEHRLGSRAACVLYLREQRDGQRRLSHGGPTVSVPAMSKATRRRGRRGCRARGAVRTAALRFLFASCVSGWPQPVPTTTSDAPSTAVAPAPMAWAGGGEGSAAGRPSSMTAEQVEDVVVATSEFTPTNATSEFTPTNGTHWWRTKLTERTWLSAS